jgi:hypothetical protein
MYVTVTSLALCSRRTTLLLSLTRSPSAAEKAWGSLSLPPGMLVGSSPSTPAATFSTAKPAQALMR